MVILLFYQNKFRELNKSSNFVGLKSLWSPKANLLDLKSIRTFKNDAIQKWYRIGP